MRFFGTDGIRNKAEDLLRGNTAYYLGLALSRGGGKIAVGRDVRLSSPQLERQLIRGLLENGAEVAVCGVLPTPALAFYAAEENCDYAVMITASHNPPEYNGLKVFGKGGEKLESEEEQTLDDAVSQYADYATNVARSYGTRLTDEEARSYGTRLTDKEARSKGTRSNSEKARAKGTRQQINENRPKGTRQTNVDAIIGESAEIEHLGAEENAVTVAGDVLHRYKQKLVSGFDRLDGERVYLDCAHGCTSGVAASVFELLGAEVISFNDGGDGTRVNVGSGATDLSLFLPEVDENAVGFSFDGDGDRVIAVVGGEAYDGDQILYALAKSYSAQGKLNPPFAIGTIMTGGALERKLKEDGIRLLRTEVGDKYVADEMKSSGAMLGGERSGHVIIADRAKTGDGILTALALMESKRVLGNLPRIKPDKRYSVNLAVSDPKTFASSSGFIEAVKCAEAEIGDRGRLIARPSGTEAVVRITVECYDDALDAEKIIKNHFLSKNLQI